jgi:sterol desaturase/sphingolipid hydroxylase (fatty acid hydroxylase superfamily)
MELTYGLVLSNVFVMIFIILEAMVIKYHLREELPVKEIATNVNSGHIVLWISRGLEITAYYYLYQYLSIGIVEDLPIWLQWTIGFIFWDFCFYCFHRTHHYFSILWAVHVVHHEGEHFNLSLGLRNSWYSQFTSLPFFIGLAIIGISPNIFLVVSSIHYFIQFYNHNHLVTKSGWLEHIMITPSHHRVHHGSNDPYIDKNFGSTFVLWDKIFGTFQLELDENPVKFGTHDKNYSANPIVLSNNPFIKLFNSNWSINLKNDPKYVLPDGLLMSGVCLVFSLFIFYVFYQDTFSYYPKAILFSIVFLGTVATGLMSEGRIFGLNLLIVSSIFLPLFMLFFYPSVLILFKIFLVLITMHGVYLLVNFKIRKMYR